ncbi:MAG: alcohol dehydrogenase-like regulatory protein ErcA [Clostridiaceae bacterium]
MYDELELRKFVVPEFVYGLDARLLVGKCAKNLGARKALVVTDPGIIEAGWLDEILSELDSYNIKYVVFSDISPNPRDYQVMAGVKVFNSENCNFILAVGGGSPMDCAKGIGILSTNSGNILDYEGVDMVTTPGPPLICIPTTAGSSADISQFAILLNTKRNAKIAIISKTVVPDIALIDPWTLSTMSPHLAACTAMDALTHAIEAYVSNAQSAISDVHAIEAIRLLASYMIPALSNLDDINMLSKLMLGSLHAGMAFSNASLGLVHAMAHSLGGRYDLPHGECNAILLEHVVAFNYKYSPSRFRQIASAMDLNTLTSSDAEVLEILIEKLRFLREGANIPAKIKCHGITSQDISILAGNALNDPCMVTNPVFPSKRDVEVLYEKII